MSAVENINEETVNTYNEKMMVIRKGIIDKINEFICNEKKSKHIERSIYNDTLYQADILKVVKLWSNRHFRSLYRDKVRSFILNLNENSYIGNNYLCNELKNGKNIKPKNCGSLHHQEIFPQRWKKLIDAKMKKDEMKMTIDKRNATDEFFCKRCKQRECTYYQLQTRSADEPMTTFVTCLNCGNYWKF